MKPTARASEKRVRSAPAPPINFSDHLEALAQKSPKQRDREKTRYLLLASVVRFSEAGSFAAMTVKDVVKGATRSY